MQETVSDVAGVAVGQEDVADRFLLGAEPPPVELLAVLGSEGDVGGVEAEGLRLEVEVPRREVEERVQQERHHEPEPSQAEDQERKRAKGSAEHPPLCGPIAG